MIHTVEVNEILSMKSANVFQISNIGTLYNFHVANISATVKAELM